MPARTHTRIHTCLVHNAPGMKNAWHKHRQKTALREMQTANVTETEALTLADIHVPPQSRHLQTARMHIATGGRRSRVQPTTSLFEWVQHLPHPSQHAPSAWATPAQHCQLHGVNFMGWIRAAVQMEQQKAPLQPMFGLRFQCPWRPRLLWSTEGDLKWQLAITPRPGSSNSLLMACLRNSWIYQIHLGSASTPAYQRSHVRVHTGPQITHQLSYTLLSLINSSLTSSPKAGTLAFIQGRGRGSSRETVSGSGIQKKQGTRSTGRANEPNRRGSRSSQGGNWEGLEWSQPERRTVLAFSFSTSSVTTRRFQKNSKPHPDLTIRLDGGQKLFVPHNLYIVRMY
ncbi:hypothetical protein BDZ97DRAFT_635775 [Flammula alnicola]|nr:hypothetical protein BDZ97DRAFT_635775 [Flammula alnicola]